MGLDGVLRASVGRLVGRSVSPSRSPLPISDHSCSQPLTAGCCRGRSRGCLWSWSSSCTRRWTRPRTWTSTRWSASSPTSSTRSRARAKQAGMAVVWVGRSGGFTHISVLHLTLLYFSFTGQDPRVHRPREAHAGAEQGAALPALQRQVTGRMSE